MQLKVRFILLQCIFLYSLFIVSHIYALAGENIRQIIDGEFEFIASIGRSMNNGTAFSHICTGIIVSNRDILTAAHCLEHEEFPNFRVHVGSRNLSLGRKYPVLFWINYEQWAGFYNTPLVYSYNDMTMIRLLRNITEQIEPAALTDRRHERFVDCDVVLAGWGRREDGSQPVIMETADVTILEITYCRNKVKRYSRNEQVFPPLLTSAVFCTVAKPYILVQQGDSGGPVIHMNTVIGINLANCPYSHLNVHPNKVNVHTAIYFYRSFIYDFIAN